MTGLPRWRASAELADAFVHVGDHADDAHPRLIGLAAADPETAADGVASGEAALRKAAVDDDDRVATAASLVEPEIAPARGLRCRCATPPAGRANREGGRSIVRSRERALRVR